MNRGFLEDRTFRSNRRERTEVLLGVDGALLFGGEEQSEQVVQQAVPQQDEVG